MSDRIFLDTNILVYSIDSGCPDKQARALEVLGGTEEFQQSTFVISTQVLQEFYVAAVRKLDQPMPEDEAEAAVRELSKLPMVQVDFDLIFAAISTSREHRLSFWDALIIRSAISSGCRILLTEDLQHGRKFGSLDIQNPFIQAGS